MYYMSYAIILINVIIARPSHTFVLHLKGIFKKRKRITRHFLYRILGRNYLLLHVSASDVKVIIAPVKIVFKISLISLTHAGQMISW